MAKKNANERVIPQSTFKVNFKDWKEKINAGEKKIARYHAQWQKYVQQSVRNYQRGVDDNDFGTNWMYPEARNAVANIYVTDPDWQAVNPNAEFQKSKRAVQRILEHIWNKLQWATPIRRALYDAWYFGIGAVKLTFTGPDQGQPNMQFTPERVAAMRQLLSDNGVTNLDEADVTRIMSGVGAAVSHDQSELRGYPALTNVSIKDFFIDPNMDEIDVNKCQFIGEKMWMPVEYIKNSPTYNKAQAGRVKGQERGGKDKPEGSQGTMWAVVHEWYDKVNGLLMTAVLEEDVLLRAVPYDGIIPYDFIAFNPVPTQFMPLPDASLVYQHAVELDELKSRMSRLMDLQRVQSLYDEAMIAEDEQLTPFLTGDDGAKVPVKVDRAMGEKLQDAIHLLTPPQIPESMYSYMGLLRDEVRNASGVTNTRAGAGREGRMTATETRAREHGTDIRTLALDHFLERLGNKVISMVRLHWDENMIALVSGERDNDELMRTYNEALESALAIGDDPTTLGEPPMPEMTIRGEFIIKVRPGSTSPQDRMAEFQKDMVILQTGLADPAVNNDKISRWFFKKHGPEEAQSWFLPDGQEGLLQGEGIFQSVAGPNSPQAQPQQAEAVNPQDAGDLFSQASG
jgi:hypothetical protein